ncbi:MAG: hypothetical protein JO055_10440 [Alphaproteobacteria bacterium]|nr:hypothetical protein [Alphaproteobacteria bacterium]
MAQLPWTEIASKPHVRHLVVGVVEDGSLIGSRRLIEKLLRALPIAGEYGVGSRLGRDQSEIHCAFQLGPDADLLANALHALPTDRYHGWRSQRRFVLDNAVRELIALVITSGQGREYARQRGKRT